VRVCTQWAAELCATGRDFPHSGTTNWGKLVQASTGIGLAEESSTNETQKIQWSLSLRHAANALFVFRKFIFLT
jgi:hypothetical protein